MTNTLSACANCRDTGLAYGFRGAHEPEEYVCNCTAGNRIRARRARDSRVSRCRVLAQECDRLGVTNAATALRAEIERIGQIQDEERRQVEEAGR